MILVSSFLRDLLKIAPLRYQENWDNSGGQIIFSENKITSVLVATDFTEEILNEAIKLKSNCIVVHHPPFFRPVKSLVDSNPAQKLVLQAIQKGISIIALHTNYDASPDTMNEYILKKLGFKETEPLTLQDGNLQKLFVYVPNKDSEKVRAALCAAGAGHIGDYSNCSFKTAGTGTFLPEKGTNPYIGSSGKLEYVEEDKIEVVFKKNQQPAIIKALLKNHPYEEVAYDIVDLKNQIPGLGRIGIYEKRTSPALLINAIKKEFKIKDIRYSHRKDKIKKVGIITGGAGSYYPLALQAGCDAYISGDIKHNEWIEANEKNFLLIDATHFATEKIFGKTLKDLLVPFDYPFKIHLSKKEARPYRLA